MSDLIINTQPKTDERIHCMFCPVQEYPFHKKAFFDKHPKARVKETLTNIFMTSQEVPDVLNIGQNKTELVPMIVFAIVYKEVE